jgi:hypothetical protein
LCITFYSEHFNNYNEKSIPAPESRDCENLSTGTTVPEKVRDPGIPVFGIPGLEALDEMLTIRFFTVGVDKAM